MAKEEYVHGYKVIFEEEAEDGYKYLHNRLDEECAKVFFVYAKHYKPAPFEDRFGKRFVLTHDSGDKYLLSQE
jgi:hypothetical protein